MALLNVSLLVEEDIPQTTQYSKYCENIFSSKHASKGKEISKLKATPAVTNT